MAEKNIDKLSATHEISRLCINNFCLIDQYASNCRFSARFALLKHNEFKQKGFPHHKSNGKAKKSSTQKRQVYAGLDKKIEDKQLTKQQSSLFDEGIPSTNLTYIN